MNEQHRAEAGRWVQRMTTGPRRLRLPTLAIVIVLSAELLAGQSASSSSSSASREADPVAILLSRTAECVARFETAFSHVVAEERYEQDVIPGTRTYVGGPRARHRELLSDFLLVRLPDSDDWVPFRDVFEVDGARVRDHDDRLVKLFVNIEGSATERAADITDESARYNIGIVRTVNHPLLALQVVRGVQQPRFRFSALPPDSSMGINISVVGYREQSSPSVIHGPAGRDMPMRGRLWIDATTGAVMRAEVLIDAVGVSAAITTRFELDPAFGAVVPIEMHEDYREANGTRITGTASYRRFRSFRVDVDFGRGQE